MHVGKLSWTADFGVYHPSDRDRERKDKIIKACEDYWKPKSSMLYLLAVG